MTCLTSIASGSAEKCQSTENYYVPVYRALFKIASEIDDESPWE